MTPNMMPPRRVPQGAPTQEMPTQPKYTLNDTKAIVCPCGNSTFREGMMLRTLSRIITGEAKDTLITVPVIICDKCGVAFQEMLPEELKTPKVSV